MKDRSAVIFNNPIDKKTIRKGKKSQKKFIRQFGDDRKKEYRLAYEPMDKIKEIPLKNFVLSDTGMPLPENALVVGNIRMGFGHYRISLAIASAARALGYEPFWFDLAGFDATGSKMIRKQNDLYSMGSKLSQKSKLFNALVWEKMNCEGFRKITYNSVDQKNSELLAPLYASLPKDVPFVATHVWPSQGAIHAGLTHVVNAIPDNWPMGLHLSEGAIHTVQTPFAYLGYKMLNGFAKKPLKPMGDDDLFLTGHYVDHELVVNLEEDTARRVGRAKRGEPMRLLLTVGGAGAGAKYYIALVKHLLPYVKRNQACVFINFGDHTKMWELMKKQIPELKSAKTYFDRYGELADFAEKITDSPAEGIYAISNKNIFEAVYSTNLLMRRCDVLVTKPSELSFYPVPKLMIKHIGGHEVYGALHAQEIGDSSFECETVESMQRMLDAFLCDKAIFYRMCDTILGLKKQGIYDGAYEAVKLAVQGRK